MLDDDVEEGIAECTVAVRGRGVGFLDGVGEAEGGPGVRGKVVQFTDGEVGEVVDEVLLCDGDHADVEQDWGDVGVGVVVCVVVDVMEHSVNHGWVIIVESDDALFSLLMYPEQVSGRK